MARKPRAPRVDVDVTGGGSVYLFHPRTRRARAWCAEHLPEDAPMLGDAYACEWRYARELAAGMLADGLEVQ